MHTLRDISAQPHAASHLHSPFCPALQPRVGLFLAGGLRAASDVGTSSAVFPNFLSCLQPRLCSEPVSPLCRS